ncbi:Flp pilus assembly complex ATPase component TadA [Candidatus Micrarchaeota archaeon]|nr:Flp pilus assembly complex ATPase component TadA [Candidatus Micrarchaeota archaeon]MBU1929891.1 Flp pilus assembly complex ATPase component TadA [Candidatus Micrarchaeota archaeon]
MLETKTCPNLKGNPDKILGWHLHAIKKEKIARILKKKSDFSIIELRNNQKQYQITSFPVFSLAEAQLVHEVLEAFQIQTSQKNSFKSLTDFLHAFTEKNQLELETDQSEYLLLVLEKLAFGLGPLGELLQNDALEEIAITGIEKPVRVFHVHYGWLHTNLYFYNEQTIKNLVNRMARKLGRRLSMQTPRLNAVLEDGSRIHAVIEPIAFSGPSVTIRKFRFQPFTPLDLLHTKTINSQALAFLGLALQSDSTILLCGNTGSGKTTTLNALFCFVPEHERIIITEETPEIRLPHQHQIKLTTSKELETSMQSLILDSLRMRPDRMIVGEMRAPEESKAFMDTLLAGQGKGSYATFHAQSTQEAVNRLKSMGIPEMDLDSIDLILVQKRWTRFHSTGFKTEERKIVEISELEWKENKLHIQPLFKFDYKTNQWHSLKNSQKVFAKIQRTFGLNPKELETELKNRQEWLESLQPSEYPLQKFFEIVNQYARP